MTTLILDPHWRRMDELFSVAAKARLEAYNVVWGEDRPIPSDVYAAAWPQAVVLIAASPKVTRSDLEVAPNLRAIIEVSGAFPTTIDYEACWEGGVEILSCSPGFRSAVAEMGLGMAITACRGLTREHEAFRRGEERWLDDCEASDVTLFGASVGFIGFGQIAQETARVMAPFLPKVSVYDPWLQEEVAARFGVRLTTLDDLAATSRILFVTAAPTRDNTGLVNAELLAKMPDHAVLIILSRAHLVDFEAVTAAAQTGRITVASDVFPSEPLPADHSIRELPNVILSPHRAAAVKGGRQPIGDMICDDLEALFAGRSERSLVVAQPHHVEALVGDADAASVASMAVERPND